MPECATNGCTHAAEHTVRYADPDEAVGYCGPCAWHNYRSNASAQAIERGVDDV